LLNLILLLKVATQVLVFLPILLKQELREIQKEHIIPPIILIPILIILNILRRILLLLMGLNTRIIRECTRKETR